MVRGGIDTVVLCTGHLGDQVRSVFGHEFEGARLIYSEETKPLGTGGALRQAWKRNPGAARWMVANGDSYLDFDARAMIEFHRAQGTAASIAAARVPDGSRFGEMEWDGARRITAFREKSGSPEPKWINGGVYILEAAFLDALPEDLPLSLENGVFPRWLDGRMSAFPCPGRFIDIGTPDSYELAQTFFEAQRV